MDQHSTHVGEQAALEALRNRAPSSCSAADISSDPAGGPELIDTLSEPAIAENSPVSAIAAAPAALADPASIVAAMHQSATDDSQFAGDVAVGQPSIFALLVRALREQRIVIIRGQAGISYAALLAFLGSLLVNGAILTFLIFLGVWAFISQASNFKYSVAGETGGSGTNGPILVESAGVSIPANPASFSTSINLPQENPVLPTHNQTVDLVPLAIAPEPTAEPTALPPINPLLEHAAPDNVIGFSAGDTFTAPKVHLPPHVADIRTDHVVPAVPKPPAQSQTAVASANNIGSQGNGGAANSNGDDSSDDPTDVFPLAKPGMGTGQGTDTGNGWDPSGANNPNPRVLSLDAIELPLEVALSGKSGRATFQVTVNPDGRAGEIKVLQSSGFESLDAVCRTAIRNAKFKPAYVAGRPVAANMVMGFPFGEQH